DIEVTMVGLLSRLKNREYFIPGLPCKLLLKEAGKDLLTRGTCSRRFLTSRDMLR
ncbi:hypothetical protein J6590_033938, partial [Homalodisca vitripennis]